jgi:hypothetical protein
MTDKIAAHRAIESFEWVNDRTQTAGNTPKEAMYNWIVNQRGSAYINVDRENIFLFGVSTTPGDHYIRAAKNNTWTDDLLKLAGESDKKDTNSAS